MGVLIPYAAGKIIQYRLKKANDVKDTNYLNTTKANAEAYKKNIGLGKNFEFSAAPFENYIQNRDAKIKSLVKDKSFKEVFAKTISEDKDLETLLLETIKKPIQESLSTHSDLKEKLGEYQKQITSFRDELKNVPPMKAEALIQKMKDTIDLGVNLIKAQQQLENTALREALEKIDLKELEKKGINPKDIKENILADLDKIHNEQLATFQKSTAASQTQLHKATQQEFEQFNFLNMIAQNEKMREALRLTAAENINELKQKVEKNEKLAKTANEEEKKRIEQENEQIRAQLQQFKAFEELSASDENFKIDESTWGQVVIADLKTIYSKTGKEIKQDDQGKFTLEIGAVLGRDGLKGYFLGNKVDHDMKLMCLAVKASGKDKILLTTEWSNKEKGIERAKQLFKAGIEAGFKPEDIRCVVKINGQNIEWSPKPADKDGKPNPDGFSPEEWNALMERSQELNSKKITILPQETNNNTQGLKNDLLSTKAQAKELEAGKKKTLDEAEDEVEKHDADILADVVKHHP